MGPFDIYLSNGNSGIWRLFQSTVGTVDIRGFRTVSVSGIPVSIVAGDSSGRVPGIGAAHPQNPGKIIIF